MDNETAANETDRQETQATATEAQAKPETQAASYASKEDLEKINSDLRAQLGRVSKLVQDLANQKKEADSDATENSNGEKVNDQAQKDLAAMATEMKGLLETHRKVKESALRNHVHRALVDAGADTDLARLAIPEVLQRYGEQMKVEDDELGGFRVVQNDAAVMAPNDLIGVFLATNEGKKLIPPKRNPNAGAMKTGSEGMFANQVSITQKEFSKLSPAEQKSGKYVFSDL